MFCKNCPEKVSVHDLWQKTSRMLFETRKQLQDYCHQTKKYTNFIVDRLSELGRHELGYYVDNEYWPRVDISFFSRETENNWQEWSREVAIEHENDSGCWDEELDKLFAINAGLKVLMTYSDSPDEEILSYLKSDKPGSFLRIYKSRKYHTADDKYLLIFGPVIGGKKRNHFSAFYFDGNKVEIMQEQIDIDFT